ncbi:LPXTG cell wall anchor domain-containing protein [Glutamicibacter sp. NPDC055491]
MLDADESNETETSEPAIDPATESSAAPTAVSDVAEESKPAVTESAASSEPEATPELTAEVVESVKATETSSDVAVQGEDPRWAQIDALMPESSEDWDEAQWEAFDQTEAGQEMNRLLDELLAEDIIWYEEFDLSDEELAFWQSINELIPEESFDWDKAQWEEYFQSDNGLELIDLILPFMMEGIESDEDAAEIQAFLEEVFANDPELRAYYLEMYFGIQPETEGEGSGDPEIEEETTPSEDKSPTAAAEIKPAGEISKAPAVEKQSITKAAGSTAPELANTGFDGFAAAGLGLLMALAGAVFVARGRRKSAKH